MNLPRIILFLVLLLPCAEAPTADGQLREQLRYRLETLREPGELVAGGQVLHAVAAVQALYQRRGWQPVWFAEDIRPPAQLDQVIDAIDLAFEHGLEPEDYHRHRLAALLGRLREGARTERDGLRIDIELLASDALLTLAGHLTHGKVDPVTIDPEWFISREPSALLDRLAEAARGENLAIRDILQTLLPAHPEYRALVERLALQRELADGDEWPVITDGALIRPGTVDPRLSEIRRRLIWLGDFGDQADPGLVELDAHYDGALEEAVVRFQQRHGLHPDAVIGPRTLAALNMPPASRIDQLRANLERWRWLPRSLGEEHIIVNIAGFSMAVVSRGEIVMEQRVVVGTPYRRTPVFTGRMTYLVLNPSWEVPHKLAVEDQLPRIRENPAYLEEMGFRVLQGWGVEERLVDPAELDWSALSARNFPYRLRQSPGPRNALGRVKFMLPNPHSVYLHDTPSRGLFSQEERAFSSGCIRLEQPDRLMYWLLSERGSVLPAERIQQVLDSGIETTVSLDRPLAVHLLYWTAWIDDEGRVQYRNDIYQRDQRLIEALGNDHPTAGRQTL